VSVWVLYVGIKNEAGPHLHSHTQTHPQPQDANMDTSEIDEIVLVGGSIRVPKIQTLLRRLFDDKEVKQSINPVGCVLN
jgi:molecular chaperone DnaK (HSP70)